MCETSIGDTTVAPVVKLNAQGKWVWGCKHSVYSGIRVDNCSRPTCISNNPINATSPIMLTEGDMHTQISLDCPGLGDDDKIGVMVDYVDIGDMEITTLSEPDGTGQDFSSSNIAIAKPT